MSRKEKDVEKMTFEEKMARFHELADKEPKPRKLKVDEQGYILLDPNNPLDREWLEDDDAYGGLIPEDKLSD